MVSLNSSAYYVSLFLSLLVAFLFCSIIRLFLCGPAFGYALLTFLAPMPDREGKILYKCIVDLFGKPELHADKVVWQSSSGNLSLGTTGTTKSW